MKIFFHIVIVVAIYKEGSKFQYFDISDLKFWDVSELCARLEFQVGSHANFVALYNQTVVPEKIPFLPHGTFFCVYFLFTPVIILFPIYQLFRLNSVYCMSTTFFIVKFQPCMRFGEEEKQEIVRKRKK